jgi:hypothetical protein
MVYFAPPHAPLSADTLNAVAGQEHPVLLVNDAGDNAGFYMLFFKFHKSRVRREVRNRLLVEISIIGGLNFGASPW